MKIKNKKAQIGEIVQDLVGFVLIAFILLLMFLISTTLWGIPKEELKNIATEQAIHDEEHISLYAFLQKTTEIEVDGKKQKMAISDLIRLSEIDPHYKTILEQEKNKAFSFYDHEFRIKSEEITVSYEITSVAGITTILPVARPLKGISFYIPSNKTIVANLEIKKIK